MIRASRSRAIKILASITFAGVAICLLAFLWIKLEPAVRGCKSVSSAGRSVKVIFHSGRYCLLSDLIWDKSGAPIVISKSNIIFDLNGFSIRGNEKQPDQVGILISDGVEGVSIENGSIESVQVGIRAQEVRDVRISGVRFSSISWVGVQLNGYAGHVQNSHFFNVGVRDDGGEGDAYAVGIMAGGEKFTIENNTFDNIIRQPAPKEQEGEGVSIIISENSSDFKIKSNNFSHPSVRYNNDIGIWIRGKNMLIDSNKFSSVKRPIAGKFDEVNHLLGNEFNFIDKFLSKDEGWIKHAAVAVNLTNSSLMVIKNNSFSGYSCPIQAFSEQQRHLALDADNNSAVWPVGGKSCLSGVWHSDVINWPEQPK